MTTEHCNAPGDLIVDGRRVATMRCELEPGHQLLGIPHWVELEWDDDQSLLGDWPERDDPAELNDVEVPLGGDDPAEG